MLHWHHPKWHHQSGWHGQLHIIWVCQFGIGGFHELFQVTDFLFLFGSDCQLTFQDVGEVGDGFMTLLACVREGLVMFLCLK